MTFRRRLLHYGPSPSQLTGSLSDRAIAGCWFELRRQGGCGDGELRLNDRFPEREAIRVGDWVACEYDVDDRWYLGRVVERTATSPAGIRLRLEGMASQLDTIFPGGYGSEADGVAPHRYGCTDLFPADPDRAHVNIDCVNRPEDLIRLLIEQYVAASTEIVLDPDLIEDATTATELAELKVRGTETATALLRDLALRSRNASWGVDEHGRFYLLQRRDAVGAEWQEGRDLVSLQEIADESLVYNRVLLTGGLVYADCGNPPCGTYRWQGNYLQPQSRSNYGERRIRLSLPWIRTPADSQAFVREFFRVYAAPTPHQRVEVARQSMLVRPWLSAIRVLDRRGNELVTAQPEVIRVQFDHSPKFRCELGPLDPRKLFASGSSADTWPIAPSDTPGFGGGPVDVTSDGSPLSSSEAGSSEDSSETSTDDFTDCDGCAFIARRWKVSFSGITSGACPDCHLINGEWILERDMGRWGCVWTAQHHACGGETVGFNEITFYKQPNFFYLMLLVKSHYAAKYRPVSNTFQCHGPNTFELWQAAPGDCRGFPATVVLQPA